MAFFFAQGYPHIVCRRLSFDSYLSYQEMQHVSIISLGHLAW